MPKNYGPNVSGYLDPTSRAFENVVTQSGKPLLDKELNLSADLDSLVNQAIIKNTIPSGWIAADFLSTGDPNAGIFTVSSVSNQLSIPGPLLAHVNGWIIPINNTNIASYNQLSLPAAPTASGSARTDIVILECWRVLLSATPSTAGKSQTARIWWNGNVKIPSGSDTALNAADDIEDPTIAAETTKRVQIQYRLRVVSGVNVFSYPYGIDDPAVIANTIPASPTAPDGIASSEAFTYSNQSVNGDPGLWVAGNGVPTNSLGTVDGYMYAIPLMAIFRRNSTAFDKNSNANGAATSPSSSDRPDGMLNDIFNTRDILDLRLGVNFRGWNYQELLDKNFNLLLDNSMRTEVGSSSLGGGSINGHTVLWADEIGLLPGNGTTTGDTPGAQFIGQFDGGRRFFSARSVYEVVTVAVTSGGSWTTGQVVTVTPSSATIYPYTAYDFLNRVPNDTVFIDLVNARFIGTTDSTKSIECPLGSITGAGSGPAFNVSPPGDILVTIGNITSLGLTTETLYLDFLIAYPPASGLTHTPTGTYGSSSISINNPGALSSSSPISYSALAGTNAIDETHREVLLQYTTVNLTITVSTDSSGVTSHIRLPERISSVSTITINSVLYGGPFTLSNDGRTIILGGGNTTSPGGNVVVVYQAIRPLPANAAQLTVWYEYREPQTARSPSIGTSITVVPRLISPFLYSLVQGAGSPDEGYPYPQAYVQTGGIYPSSSGTYTGEAELNGASTISIADFNATTGMMRVMTNIPYTPSPEQVTFTRSSGDVDVEGRTFFKSVPGGVYVPSAYGQNLSDARRHKVILPMLVETTTNSTLCPKGTLLLACLIRYAEFDSNNDVVFNSDLTANTTSASFYRLKGNLLNRSL